MFRWCRVLRITVKTDYYSDEVKNPLENSEHGSDIT